MTNTLQKEVIPIQKWDDGEQEHIAVNIQQIKPSLLKIIDNNMTYLGNKFPDAACNNGIYSIIDNTEWTTSFWTGQIWLAYEWTEDKKYRTLAQQHINSFAKRIVLRNHTNHHDLGFLYTLSCLAAKKLTNDTRAGYIALLAAETLLERYHEKCGIIQAWGELDDPEQHGRMIIDCNMNLPLLHQASQLSGDLKYTHIARQHIEQASRYIVRPDGSTFHTFYMDVHTGKPRFGNTHQGLSDESCWARGQAWGIYGFLLNYRYIQDERLLELSQILTNYLINRLPEDFVCYWDLSLTDPASERDSSAAAIVVCALFELVKHLPPTHPDRGNYEIIALRILNNLIKHYANRDPIPGSGLLKHSVYHFKGNVGVNECCSWGDYFLMEAITRATKNWHSYW
ncbi:glycoside hydrolase family 88 protein [Vibrio mimicus]|uniref:glycoside hydrolase family 88 protein n=1 Tax=Vibrio mimicus TaxID=674 RepID=UPI002FF438D9